MIVFVPDELESARWFAREAVEIGSEKGGGLDWEIAMDKLKMALGYADITTIDRFVQEEEINTYGNSQG